MGRPRKKPEYDPEKVMNEILDTVVQAYEHLDEYQRLDGQLAHGALKDLSDELGLTPSKVKKLLITAGVRDKREIYRYGASREVLTLYAEGKSIQEIMNSTGLKRSAVFGYLPYSKNVYKAQELSTDAERIKLYRSRQMTCHDFMTDIIMMSQEDKETFLWETLELLQGCIFYTSGRGNSKGIRFKYAIRGGEMFINRKEKSITKSTVILAFHRAMEIQDSEGCVPGPKKLGTFGASYLYPIFLRLGVCTTSVEGSVINMG